MSITDISASRCRQYCTSSTGNGNSDKTLANCDGQIPRKGRGNHDGRISRISEFDVDFAKPNGIGYDLGPMYPSGPSSLVIQRSSSGKGFSQRDREIIDIISPHVSNLLSTREKLDRLVKEKRAPREDIRSCFPILSKREAQVAAYLCDGLSAREIASTLLIGVRTVETYIAHLYFKLDVLCKADAIRLIRSRLEGSSST